MVKIFYCINLKAIAAFSVSVFYNVLFIDGNASESSLFSCFFFFLGRKNMSFLPYPWYLQRLTHSILLKLFHSSRSPPTFCSNLLILNCFLLILEKNYTTFLNIEVSNSLFFFFLHSLAVFCLEVSLNRIPPFSWKPKSSSPQASCSTLDGIMNL